MAKRSLFFPNLARENADQNAVDTQKATFPIKIKNKTANTVMRRETHSFYPPVINPFEDASVPHQRSHSCHEAASCVSEKDAAYLEPLEFGLGVHINSWELFRVVFDEPAITARHPLV